MKFGLRNTIEEVKMRGFLGKGIGGYIIKTKKASQKCEALRLILDSNQGPTD